MADYKYEIQIQHQDVKGEVKAEYTLNGPHLVELLNLRDKAIVKLDHLPQNPADPQFVRLKLVLKDNL